MAILNFEQITDQHKFIGGKAFHLARLSQQSFPVPQSIVVSGQLLDQDFAEVCQWWAAAGQPPLAVRSSAADEDGSDYSFAGQNSSFLNITTEIALKKAINDCFDSINKASSQAYRQHFLGSSGKSKMNVLIQEMVKPLFAGVYFSSDPRNNEDKDLIEFVEGLGESLVSGEVTPYQVNGKNSKAATHPNWSPTFSEDLFNLGHKVKDYLGEEVDMEWAIDHRDRLFLLQARPITTSFNTSTHSEVAHKELLRLQQNFEPETSWDGQTFAEWTGLPSDLSFSLYQEAFSNQFAYGRALKRLGYLSFKSSSEVPNSESVLERVFGRAFINLNKLGPLFFGPIPYSIVARPRPHLEFNWRLINLRTILSTPMSVAKMIKVGWNLSSKRSQWLQECQKELGKFQNKMNRPLKLDLYKDWSNEELLKRFRKETYRFSKYHLLWPFILTVLIESTMRSLSSITSSVLGKEQAPNTIKRWIATGLHTITYDMKRYYDKACADPKKQDFFMSRYGHRGAGELDLRNPRWIEHGARAFAKKTNTPIRPKRKENENLIIDEINRLQTFKKSIILQEWKLLKSMLELREQWKMSILKPFAQIRFITEELARRSGLNSDIYFLSQREILEHKVCKPESVSAELLEKIEQRKKKEQSFKFYALPPIVSLPQIERIVNGDNIEENSAMHGEPISPGLVFGTVKVIRDVNSVDVDLNNLPEDMIIVAESTDPGWTPVFAQTKGIIVEHGGILSHSAIVAREMGIPAVSSVFNCVNKFKDGERICLDGNKGLISYE